MLILALALLSACLPSAQAESTLLPPSALALQRSMALKTGDLVEELPDISFNALDNAGAAALVDAMSAYEAPETSLLVNNAESYFCYDHLEPLARQIYDIILQIARDPVSELNIHVMQTTVDPFSDQFMFAYFSALFAATIDHAELFWLYPHAGEATIIPCGVPELVNGRYTVFFRMEEPYEPFEARMTAFNDAAQAFLKDIDRSASTVEIVKQIHDKLMALVTYDTATCNRHEADLAHTAYGCLVSNTEGNANFAVCDGYSLCFEYMLQQCGIPAAVIYGKGGPSPSEMGGHAWSIVELDGNWYEVDSTWDDNAVDEVMMRESFTDEGIVEMMLEILADPDYYEKHGHQLFLISSDLMEHYIAPTNVDWSFTFSDGYGPIDMTPSECYHERESAGMRDEHDTDSARAVLTYKIPRAGQSYSY